MSSDTATGLPKMPPGYKWKIKIFWSEWSDVPVAGVSLKKGIWTQVYTEAPLGFLDPRDKTANGNLYARTYPLIKADPSQYPNIIREAAEKLVGEFAKKLDNDKFMAEYYVVAKNLSGSYPPKKLN